MIKGPKLNTPVWGWQGRDPLQVLTTGPWGRVAWLAVSNQQLSMMLTCPAQDTSLATEGDWWAEQAAERSP